MALKQLMDGFKNGQRGLDFPVETEQVKKPLYH